jgi:hypothetical protein
MAQRCAAHNRQGGQCGHLAMRAQTVCRYHGGKNPHALANAEERLRALVHPAITGLAELIARADSDSVRLSAIKDVLDRTGFRPADVQPEQQAIMHVTVAFDHANTHADTLENITFSLPDATD